MAKKITLLTIVSENKHSEVYKIVIPNTNKVDNIKKVIDNVHGLETIRELTIDYDMFSTEGRFFDPVYWCYFTFTTQIIEVFE